MNDNKTNPETCMPAACTVRAAHEAQRVADPQGIATITFHDKCACVTSF